MVLLVGKVFDYGQRLRKYQEAKFSGPCWGPAHGTEADGACPASQTDRVPTVRSRAFARTVFRGSGSSPSSPFRFKSRCPPRVGGSIRTKGSISIFVLCLIFTVASPLPGTLPWGEDLGAAPLN